MSKRKTIFGSDVWGSWNPPTTKREKKRAKTYLEKHGFLKRSSGHIGAGHKHGKSGVKWL